MVTIEQIEQVLMEPSERGMRAVGRALVLLYSPMQRGQHSHPIGRSMAEFFLNHGRLTTKQLNYWRKPLHDGTPHILLHRQEILLFAQLKEQRKLHRVKQITTSDISLLNQRNDLMGMVQDVIGAPEREILAAALLALRKFERQHGLTPATIQGIAKEDEEINSRLDAEDPQHIKNVEKRAKEYRDQSNGA